MSDVDYPVSTREEAQLPREATHARRAETRPSQTGESESIGRADIMCICEYIVRPLPLRQRRREALGASLSRSAEGAEALRPRAILLRPKGVHQTYSWYSTVLTVLHGTHGTPRYSTVIPVLGSTEGLEARQPRVRLLRRALRRVRPHLPPAGREKTILVAKRRIRAYINDA